MARAQTQQVVIRMTAEDFEVMKNYVEKSGLKQAEYLRQVILKPRIISTEGMKEIVPELKRVGNNLNQIARAVNAGAYDLKMTDEVMRIGKELDNIWQLLRQFVAGQA